MIAHNLEKFVDVIFMYTYMYVRVCLQQSFNAAMVSALKALQKKIRGLEVDRVIAGERLKHLSEEAQRHPQLLLNQEKTPVPSHPYSPNTTSDQHDVQKRLCRVDTRFREQAVELNGVKERLCEAEAKQQQCFICSEMLEQQHKELLQHQKKILRHLSSKKSATAVQDTVTSPSKRKKKVWITALLYKYLINIPHLERQSKV
jgi:hypothetical protein